MHETGLARDLVTRALAEIPPGERVKAVRIGLGPGEVDAEALRFSIEALCRGTAAEGAEVIATPVDRPGVLLESLDVEEVP